MKKLIVIFCLIACLGFMSSPVLALPSCPHTNAQGMTSKNFGNCILNVLIVIGTFGIKARQYFCNAAPGVLAVAQQVLAITGFPIPAEIVNICNSIIAVGCSDNVSLADLIAFIESYNKAQVAKLHLTGTVKTIDPSPIIDWTK
jgi:hypothetical protein